MWLSFWTVFVSCYGLALLQENECKDTLTQCSGLITENTKIACYEQNLGEAGVDISKVCCETCKSFKDPNALEGCEYGDRSLICGQQNCTDPPDGNTKLCCKTCQANIEAELASLTTTQATNGETTASGTNSGPSTTSPAVQKPAAQATTASETTAAASTTPSLTSSTSLSTTTEQPTSTDSQTTTESVTTKGLSQQDTSTAVPTSGPTTSQMTSTTGPSQQDTTPAAAVESTKPCRDAKRCKNIRPHECYSTYTRERCCESCKMITETKPKDCPYGDRLPLWCVLQILRSPRTICRSHDDLCCESCQFVGTSTSRSRVLLLRRKPTIWEKIKKKRKGKKGKGRRKGKGKKSKRHRRRIH